jgi:predicted transcriptional regulator/adenine/guanine phosphoribosyltransferase-like PRPP-binding protein
MKSEEKILSFLQTKEMSTVEEIAKNVGFSRQYIHRLLDRLIDKAFVEKNGKIPHVYYRICDSKKNTENPKITLEKERFLFEHFLLVQAMGNMLQGVEAMQYWCAIQQLDFNKTTAEYIETRKKYLAYFNKEGFIDGLQKLQNTSGMKEIGVDYLFYMDFYAIERFGKTHLGTLMHYAKQGQNKSLMKIIVSEIKYRIANFINENQIDAIVFVPPTIKRHLQIMDFFEKNIGVDLPKITVKKIKNNIIIPQKALSKLAERIENAKKTFYVGENKSYRKILILDDAVGSGATINEIALKIKTAGIASEIYGLAITGSYKGFDVISEI